MEVLKKLFCRLCVVFVVYKMGEAQYTTRPRNSVVNRTSNMTLRCSADDDNADVIWYEYITNSTGTQISYNNEVCHPNQEKYEIVGKYDLLINHTDWSDAGTYSCHLPGPATYSYMELFIITYTYSACFEEMMEHERRELGYVVGQFYGGWHGDGQVTGLADNSTLDLWVYHDEDLYKEVQVSAFLTATMLHHENKFTCRAFIDSPDSSDVPPDSELHYYDRSAPGTVHTCSGVINVTSPVTTTTTALPTTTESGSKTLGINMFIMCVIGFVQTTISYAHLL